MLAALLLVSVALARSAAYRPAGPDDPCRRPHCTIAQGDLLTWLSLIAWEPRFEGDRFEIGRGEGRYPWSAASRLWELHVFGHGGWPDMQSPSLLVEVDSVPCDPKCLLALYTALSSRLASRRDEDRHLLWLVDDIASLLERNGKFDLAEEILRLAIPADCTPDTSSSQRDHMEWFELGRFLFRRGRHDEALWIFERLPELGGGCSMASNPNLDWMERCCAALADEVGLFEVWRRRIKGNKSMDAGWSAAKYFTAQGFPFPEAEASRWFDALSDGTFAPIPRDSARRSFLDGVERWRRWAAGERWEHYVDVSAPGGVEIAVSRAREIAASDAGAASSLLRDAAKTGSPLAGIAILELAADPRIRWKDSDRAWLREYWREAILTRTYGCADPDDPSTW